MQGEGSRETQVRVMSGETLGTEKELIKHWEQDGANIGDAVQVWREGKGKLLQLSIIR